MKLVFKSSTSSIVPVLAFFALGYFGINSIRGAEWDSWEITGFEKIVSLAGSYYSFNSGEQGFARKQITGPGMLLFEYRELDDGQDYESDGWIFSLDGDPVEGIGGRYHIPEGIFNAVFDVRSYGKLTSLVYYSGYSLDLGLMSWPWRGGEVEFVPEPKLELYLTNNNFQRFVFFDEGTSIEMEAVPADGNQFAEWDGDFLGEGVKVNLEMERNYRAAPVFEANDTGVEYVTGFRGDLPVVNLSEDIEYARWSYRIKKGDSEIRSILFDVEGPGFFSASFSGMQTESLIGEARFLRLDGVDKPVQYTYFHAGDDPVYPIWITSGQHRVEFGIDASKVSFDGSDHLETIIELNFTSFDPYPMNRTYREWFDEYVLDSFKDEGPLEPFEDFDRDGLSNFAEYLLGTNPFEKGNYLNMYFDPVKGFPILTYYKDHSLLSNRLRLYSGFPAYDKIGFDWYRLGDFEYGERDLNNLNLYHVTLFDFDGKISNKERFFKLQLEVLVPSLEELLNLQTD